MENRDIIDSDNTMIELVRDAGLELSSIEELRTQLKQYSGSMCHISHFIHSFFNLTENELISNRI